MKLYIQSAIRIIKNQIHKLLKMLCKTQPIIYLRYIGNIWNQGKYFVDIDLFQVNQPIINNITYLDNSIIENSIARTMIK